MFRRWRGDWGTGIMSDYDFTDESDAYLETLVVGDGAAPAKRGAAKAELTKRQRAYEKMRAEEDDYREVLRKI
jgi:hypothetical protein